MAKLTMEEMAELIYRQRVMDGEANLVKDLATNLLADISTIMKSDRKYSDMLKRTKTLTDNGLLSISGVISEAAQIFAQNAAPRTSKAILKKTVNSFQGLGGTMEDQLRNWRGNFVSQISNEMARQNQLGTATPDLYKAIVGTYDNTTKEYKGGLLSTKLPNSAEAQSRTLNKMAEQLGEDTQRREDGAIGYEWVSVLDGRTSTTCMALDGKKFFYDRSGAKPIPPQHPNCRSGTMGLYEENGKIVRRKSDLKNQDGDGSKYDPDMTVNSWVKEESKKPLTGYGVDGPVQAWESETGALHYGYSAKAAAEKGWKKAYGGEARKAMGETRWKLYTKGKLKIERFTDVGFQPLNLEAMAKRSNIAFKRAKVPDPRSAPVPKAVPITDEIIEAVAVEAAAKKTIAEEVEDQIDERDELQYQLGLQEKEAERLAKQAAADKEAYNSALQREKMLASGDPGTEDINLEDIYADVIGKPFVPKGGSKINSSASEVRRGVNNMGQKDFIDSITLFTSDAYTDIRNHQWGRKNVSGSMYGTTAAREMAEELESAQNQYRYNNRQEIHRGLSYKKKDPKQMEYYKEMTGLKPGDTYMDKGTSSWSRRKGVAESFAETKYDNTESVIINIKPDEPLGHYIAPISSFQTEEEVLMRAKQSLEVISNKVVNGVREIEMKPVTKKMNSKKIKPQKDAAAASKKAAKTQADLVKQTRDKINNINNTIAADAEGYLKEIAANGNAVERKYALSNYYEIKKAQLISQGMSRRAAGTKALKLGNDIMKANTK